MSGIFDTGIFDTGIFDTPVNGGNGMASAPVNRLDNNVVRVLVNPATSGSNTIVAAAGAGIKIRVVSVVVMAAAANTISFLSASTDITCDFAIAANGGFVLDHNPSGWFQTAANEALNVDLSASTAVGIMINYQLTQV